MPRGFESDGRVIDEKRLEEILHFHPDDWTLEEHDTVYRLARVGMWAEKHGIPALKQCQDPLINDQAIIADDALAALPKPSTP